MRWVEWVRGGRRRRISPTLIGVVVGMLVVNLMVLQRTGAAFTSSTSNSGNAHASATLTLSDNDNGNLKMFNLTGLTPGNSASSCIKVTYDGTVPATVRMYGTTTGTGLDAYLDVTVTRGTISSGSFGDCTNFTADATNYLALGNGVLYDGTLQGFADTYSAGIADAAPAYPEVWTTSEVHAYRVDVTVQNNVGAQGLTANQTFTWEARDLKQGYPSQLAGTDGCLSETGNSGACTDVFGLDEIAQVVVSPDGRHLYAASRTSDAVTAFARNTNTGKLTQLAGTAGCVSETGSGGACADGVALDRASGIAISPDGNSVYVASETSNSVASFSRNVTTGQLTQLAGTAACVSETGTGGACVDGVGLNGALHVAVSPDGTSVYAAAYSSGAITAFTRNTTTGALTPLAGTAACVSFNGTSGACVTGTALTQPWSVEVSPDGKNVYTATGSNAVAVFTRNTGTGQLTQLAGTAGCVSEDGTSGSCVDGVGLTGAFKTAVSPDGNNVYVSGYQGSQVASFTRNPATGQLTQLSGVSACISETGNGGSCIDGVALSGARGVVVSADGRRVYVVAQDALSVLVLWRDTVTGQLTQSTANTRCVSDTGLGGLCVDGAQLTNPIGLAVDPGGRNVYVGSYGNDSITVFST